MSDTSDGTLVEEESESKVRLDTEAENDARSFADPSEDDDEDAKEIPAVEEKPAFKIPQPDIQIHEGMFDSHRVRFLVYGESGVGKTVFASSWPSVIFLDIDDGMASVTRKVARIPIHSWVDLQDAYLFLKFGEHKFKTVVIDSLNETQHLAMQNTISTFPAIHRAYDDLPSISDYGKALDDFDKVVRYFRALPMNIVFIAQVATKENEQQQIQPHFTGKATGRSVSRMMDCIAYMYKGESTDQRKPRLLAFDDVNFVAKDRSDRLPITITNPTYDKLLSYWTKKG